MKVLFVCKGNVNRSQIAEAFYNLFSNSNDADSAGVEVELSGLTLTKRREIVGDRDSIDLMKSQGLDISNKTLTLLTNDMLQRYDQVISMCDPVVAPEWLVSSPNYEYWEIKDPAGYDETVFLETLEAVKAKVKHMTDNKFQ